MPTSIPKPPSVQALLRASGAFLSSLPAATRREGEEYFQRQAVREVEMLGPEDAAVLATQVGVPDWDEDEDLFEAGVQEDEDGESVPGETVWFRASVAGSARRPYDVALRWDVGAGPGSVRGRWGGYCSCPMGNFCKHIAAATLFVEDLAGREPLVLAGDLQRVAALRSLAGSEPASAGSAAGPIPPPAVKRSAQVPARPVARRRKLAEVAEAKLGRSLTPEERSYVDALDRLWADVRVQRQFTGWHAETLGLRTGKNRWGDLKIWPSLPNDALEMWSHVAYAATTWWQCSIPPFLAAVAEEHPVDAALQEWRRRKSVTWWKERLAQVALEPSSSPTVGELRWVLAPTRAYAEVREGGEFREVRPGTLRSLENRMAMGELEWTPEAELYWDLLIDRSNYSGVCEARYGLSEDMELLTRLVSSPVLRSGLVNELGAPYRHVPEPLPWRLGEPADGHGEYRLRLELPDGSPLPSMRLGLQARGVLYLVGPDTIHVTRPLPATFGPPRREMAIPAQALESPEGIQLLRHLGLELPARLRDRVRVEPLGVVIECQIEDSPLGRSGEYCRVVMRAESGDDEVRLRWHGVGWQDEPVNLMERKARRQSAAARGKGGAAADTIVTYDRGALAKGRVCLELLGARWDNGAPFGRLRMTRKFPAQFSEWLKSLPPEVRVQLDDELSSLAADVTAGTVRLDVQEDGIDWFNLKVLLDVSETDLTPAEIKLLLDARGDYVRLKGKGWRRLKFDLSDEEDERLARLGLNPRELTSEAQRLHVLQLADPAAKRFLEPAQFERVQRRAGELQARVNPEPPTALRAELRPYQTEGFHFLCYLATNRFGGILADDMGLGKTVQTLAWVAWLRSARENHGRPSLVVCPKSVVDNWQGEAARFLPGLRVRVWSGVDLESLPSDLATADLHVLNYSQLRGVGTALEGVEWLAAILDEGQYIKNPDSQTAHVARRLRATHRLILTGTPIENRLMDLWSLMSFAMPGALGSRAQFQRMFGGKEDPHARRRLSARVRPFLLRRTKGQVARDLPDKIEEDLRCEMEGGQKTLYRAELKRAQQMLLRLKTAKQLAEERFSVLTSLLRLRQICCDPRLVQPDSPAPGAKLEALLDQLEPLMEEGQKVLVFSQFVGMLDLIREAVREKGWRDFYLAGDTEDRGALVNEFQTAPGAAVFLISLKAGGFGLNLTAAGYVILFDPWWNPAVENQAIDRTHRIGQTQKVIAYRLVMKDSVEEKIRGLQRTKRQMAEDVLGEEKFSQSLTLEDLRFLLAD